VSLTTYRTCDICGRSENRYGAVAAQYVEYEPGKHACGTACALVVLFRALRGLVA
jgi:hypothetical protein